MSRSVSPVPLERVWHALTDPRMNGRAEYSAGLGRVQENERCVRAGVSAPADSAGAGLARHDEAPELAGVSSRPRQDPDLQPLG